MVSTTRLCRYKLLYHRRPQITVMGLPLALTSSLLHARRGPDPQAGLPLASQHHTGPELLVQRPLLPPRAGLKAQAASYMMSTKNSQGFPMAFWKDWRLPVNSGGTAASSRTGGPPGGPPTTA